MDDEEEPDMEADGKTDLYAENGGKNLLAPLWWWEPKVHPELVNHGAALARLALELAQFERTTGKARTPLECLHDANVLLQSACEMVPHTVNLSRGSEDERQRWVVDQIDGSLRTTYVPWSLICSESTPAHSAPLTPVRIQVNGGVFVYHWKAYVQVEKAGGLRALLLRHALRMAFECPHGRSTMRKMRRALQLFALHRHHRSMPKMERQAWSEKRRDRMRARVTRGRAAKSKRERRSLCGILRMSSLAWTVGFFRAAIRSCCAPKQWTDTKWQQEILDNWREASAQDFAARLLDDARNGRLRLVDFESIALTRKLHPPGGAQRRNSGASRRTSGGKKTSVKK